jgi:transcriptional regulator with XRE-family HTH domain
VQEKSDSYALFSDRVEALRTRLGGNMSEVAKALGVSRTMIYDIKNERVPVSDKMWRKLRDAEAAVERKQMHEDIGGAPADVRAKFIGPELARQHYMELEALYEMLLAEHGGTVMSADERADFQELLRGWTERRPRARRALLDVLDLADKIGEIALARHIMAEHAAAERDLQKAKAQGKFKTEAPPGQKSRPA